MGAGANVHAGIYLPTPLQNEVTVDFTTHDDACMNNSGNAASMTIAKGTTGVQCTSVGYVEAKVSGCKCLSAASLWTLGYNIENTPYSGSVQSQWYTPPEFNSIQLNNPGSTTVNTICAKGNDTYQKWHGTGTLYIIFSPITTAAIQHLPLMWYVTPEEKHHHIEELFGPLVDEHLFEASKPTCFKKDEE